MSHNLAICPVCNGNEIKGEECVNCGTPLTRFIEKKQPSPVFIPSGGYYTIPEVAALFGEDRRTINNWLKAGRLQGVKTGIGWLVWADGVKEFVPPKPGPKPSS